MVISTSFSVKIRVLGITILRTASNKDSPQKVSAQSVKKWLSYGLRNLGRDMQAYPMLSPKVEEGQNLLVSLYYTKDSPQKGSAQSVKKWLSY